MGFKEGVHYSFNDFEDVIQISSILIGGQKEIWREKSSCQETNSGEIHRKFYFSVIQVTEK